jgi:hypothetical protein
MADLVMRARGGDKLAWDGIVERYAPLIWWVLRTAPLPTTTGLALDAENIADTQAAEVEQELLMAERNAALREALADLPLGSRRLITLLIADPPWSYAEISVALGIPIGSIGPSRRRCLEKLRRHPAIAMLISDEVTSRGDTTDHVR